MHGLRGTWCESFGMCGAWLMSLGVGKIDACIRLYIGYFSNEVS